MAGKALSWPAQNIPKIIKSHSRRWTLFLCLCEFLCCVTLRCSSRVCVAPPGAKTAPRVWPPPRPGRHASVSVCRGTASAELIVGVGIAQPQNVRIYLYMQLLTYGATATARPSGAWWLGQRCHASLEFGGCSARHRSTSMSGVVASRLSASLLHHLMQDLVLSGAPWKTNTGLTKAVSRGVAMSRGVCPVRE